MREKIKYLGIFLAGIFAWPYYPWLHKQRFYNWFLIWFYNRTNKYLYIGISHFYGQSS